MRLSVRGTAPPAADVVAVVAVVTVVAESGVVGVVPGSAAFPDTPTLVPAPAPAPDPAPASAPDPDPDPDPEPEAKTRRPPASGISARISKGPSPCSSSSLPPADGNKSPKPLLRPSSWSTNTAPSVPSAASTRTAHDLLPLVVALDAALPATGPEDAVGATPERFFIAYGTALSSLPCLGLLGLGGANSGGLPGSAVRPEGLCASRAAPPGRCCPSTACSLLGECCGVCGAAAAVAACVVSGAVCRARACAWPPLPPPWPRRARLGRAGLAW